jgi:hypothetical protein
MPWENLRHCGTCDWRVARWEYPRYPDGTKPDAYMETLPNEVAAAQFIAEHLAGPPANQPQPRRNP